VLWGLYHGLLLVATRARQAPRRSTSIVSTWLAIPQVLGMFC
jgi:D-alanyl-lipoteichoic acid acyltransferase DltB (MBOAT superfamily)